METQQTPSEEGKLAEYLKFCHVLHEYAREVHAAFYSGVDMGVTHLPEINAFAKYSIEGEDIFSLEMRIELITPNLKKEDLNVIPRFISFFGDEEWCFNEKVKIGVSDGVKTLRYTI